MTTEVCQLSESNEYNKEKCNTLLDNLEKNSQETMYINAPFEKDDNWYYNLLLEWEKLNIALSAEQLIKLYDKIQRSLMAYQWVYEKYTKEEFRDWYINDGISLDANGLDKTHFSEDLLREIFWDDYESDKQEIIIFMNKLINKFSNNNNKRVDQLNISEDLDKINMEENIKIINQINEIWFEDFQWLSIKEIIESNRTNDRVESLRNILYLIHNNLPVDLSTLQRNGETKTKTYISLVSELRPLTYEDFVYNSASWTFGWWNIVNLEYSDSDNKVYVYSGKSTWDIKQSIWSFTVKNVNDRVILSVLVWNRKIEDYKIPRISSSQYEWSRDIQK